MYPASFFAQPGYFTSRVHPYSRHQSCRCSGLPQSSDNAEDGCTRLARRVRKSNSKRLFIFCTFKIADIFIPAIRNNSAFLLAGCFLMKYPGQVSQSSLLREVYPYMGFHDRYDSSAVRKRTLPHGLIYFSPTTLFNTLNSQNIHHSFLPFCRTYPSPGAHARAMPVPWAFFYPADINRYFIFAPPLARLLTLSFQRKQMLMAPTLRLAASGTDIQPEPTWARSSQP